MQAAIRVSCVVAQRSSSPISLGVRRSLPFILSATCVACTADGQNASESGSSADGSGDSETGDTGELGPLLVSEPSIVLHPKQPMIVDVIVELDAPGTGELIHPDDDVGVFLLSPAPGEAASTLHFRVRGLLPASTHALALSVTEADGDRTGSWSGSVVTNEPLPGFIAKFEIDTPDSALVSDDRRLFDMTRLFTTEPSGLFLVDNEGTTRWYLGDVDEYTDQHDIWSGVRLRPDGTVSFTRRNTAFIVDELGEYQMQVTAESIGANAGIHHDLTELPNGNFLTLGYTFADVDYADDGTLHVAGDIIYEFTPDGELVWTWSSFDYLDPQRRRAGFDNPQKIPDPDTNQDGYDWTHGNGLTYTQADDTIYLSMRHQDWILAIDHASGDLRWKLGDEGDFTLVGDDRWFFHQHSVEWQADGSMMVYDNGIGNPAQPDADAHSRAVRYELDVDAMTATKVWSDDDPKFASSLAGDADRMSNGSVLRLDSTWVDDENTIAGSRMHELDPGRTPNLVWSLVAPPGRFCYRAVPITRWVGEAG